MSTIQQNANAEQILQSAVKLFSRKGYDATSTREIMEAAGVTKPMLYYYFGSKEGLCQTALTRFSDHFFACLKAEIDKPRPPRDTLVEVVWLHFRFLLENEDANRLYLMIYFGPERHRFADIIDRDTQRAHALFLQAVERIDKEGILRPGCAHDFFMALHGTIHFWALEAMERRATVDRPLAERIVDGLLHGYGKP